ncbi:hypothetical protein B484DRAFT_444142 [Ochromonadaceae sp. CCMP2298]|nr:hypothetical protein B484DRAFT_444142 [Ochromonadaceae sp. CCMP2298]
MVWLRLLVSAVGIAAALYYLRGPLLGFLLTSSIQLCFSKTLKTFVLGSFHILPFHMGDFHLTFRATRSSPEATVKWRSFKILLDITKIFDPLLSLLLVLPTVPDVSLPQRPRMLVFEFEEFAASSPGLSFADFLNPSDSKMAPEPDPSKINEEGDEIIDRGVVEAPRISNGLILKRLMRHIVLFTDIHFKGFAFDLLFPSHESAMQGVAQSMLICFPSCSEDESMMVMVKVEGGKMDILHREQKAMAYVGQHARLQVEVHLPTGIMDVLMAISGRQDEMHVQITPFLAFMGQYQVAEDDSIEIKMARGLSTGGKMAMRLECEYIRISLTDPRCPEELWMNLQHLEAELKNYNLTRSNDRMYKGKLCSPPPDMHDVATGFQQKLYKLFSRSKDGPIVLSPNKEKVMKAMVGRVDFHTQEVGSTGYVEEVSMLKTKRVYNENDFIDDDKMKGFAKIIHFHKLSAKLLDWMVVLQDTANRVPDSRFAHKKHSQIDFLGHQFFFSTAPVSCSFVPPTEADELSDDASALELNELEEIPVDADNWVSFSIKEMNVQKVLPCGEVDSDIAFHCAQMLMETVLPEKQLQNQYNISVGEGGDEEVGAEGKECKEARREVEEDHSFPLPAGLTGTRWTMPSMAVKVKMGPRLTPQRVSAGLLQVEFGNSSGGSRRLLSAIGSGMGQSLSLDQSLLYHPFLLTSNLTASWSEQHILAELGSVNVKASAAGMIKFMCGMGMIRKTVDRVAARMTYIKVQGGPVPGAYPPPIDLEKQESSTTVRMSELTLDIPVDITSNFSKKPDTRHRSASMESRRSDRSQPTSFDGSPKSPGRKSMAGAGGGEAGPKEGNKGDKSLSVLITNFEYMSGTVESGARFDVCCVGLQNYTAKPWMYMEAFEYRKTNVPLSVGDAFYQGLDPRNAEAAGVTEKVRMYVSIEKFDVFLSARMELGVVLDALMAQAAAYKVASLPPPKELASAPSSRSSSRSNSRSSSRSSSRSRSGSLYESREAEATFTGNRSWDHGDGYRDEDEAEKAEEIPTSPQVLHVAVSTFTVVFDAHYRGDFVDEFMRIEMADCDLLLDSTKLPTAVQDEITLLDLGPRGKETQREVEELDQLMIYAGISGGQMAMSIAQGKGTFKPYKEALFEFHKLGYSGPVYMATVSDPRIAKEYALVPLSDSVPLYAPDEAAPPMGGPATRSGRSVKLNNERQSLARRQSIRCSLVEGDDDAGCSEALYAVTIRTAAPSKIYLDLAMAAQSWDICAHPATSNCIDAVNAAMDCILPPNKDSSPSLAPWDNLRYQLHGSFTFTSERLAFSMVAKDFMLQSVRLRASMEYVKWFMDSSSFSLTAQNLVVDAELNSKLLGHRRGQSNKKTVTSVHSKFCTIPAFIFSLHHKDDTEAPSLGSPPVWGGPNPATPLSMPGSVRKYSHHDVYLHPALLVPKAGKQQRQQYIHADKFHFFRTPEASKRLDVEVRLADSASDPVCFTFRLDHLSRVLDTFRGSAEAEDVEETDCVDSAADYNRGVVRSPCSTPFSHMIAQQKVLLVLNKIVISSWPSQSNLGGFVITIHSSDMQLRMLRDKAYLPVAQADDRTPSDTDQSLAPMKIDHFLMETTFVDIYVRHWQMPDPEAGTDDAGAEWTGDRRGSDVSPETIPGKRTRDEEPRSVLDVYSLFMPIYKTVHSSNIVISLTESGAVSIRDHLFAQTGILHKCDERSAEGHRGKGKPSLPSLFDSVFVVGKEWLELQEAEHRHHPQHTQEPRAARCFSLHARRASAVRLRFDEPQPDGRRESMSVRRRKSMSASVLAVAENNPSPSQRHTQRDGPPSVRRPRRRTSVRGRLLERAQRALLSTRAWDPLVDGYRASLLYFAANHSAFTPPPSALPLAHAAGGGFLQGRDRAQTFFADQDQTSSSWGKKIWGLRVTDMRLLFTIEIRDVLFGYFARATELFEAAESTNAEGSARVSDKVQEPEGGVKKEQKATVFDFMPDDEEVDPFVPLSSTVQATQSTQQTSLQATDAMLALLAYNSAIRSGAPTAVPTRRKEAFKDGVDVSVFHNDAFNENLEATRNALMEDEGKSADSHSEAHSIPSDTGPSSRSPPNPKASAPPKAKPKGPSRYFFVVQLIDPQINFLDTKAHSSVIIVAGRSSLEGKKYTHATLPPQAGAEGNMRSSIAGMRADPQRQQELRLRMDGVSAFTVPSSSPDDEDDESDTVHWKHMANTSVSQAPGSTQRPPSLESPYMRMAINDFQIRAQYIFWTDVTVREARNMQLRRSSEKLVCTFKLELPVIGVDILSWQFYVIMNVVRNVLLVPPPASASHVNKRTDVDEAQKNKVLELKRSAELLARHEIRCNINAALDLKSKHNRDELRYLVEEGLAQAMLEMDLGSARFVEIFIGSCTWVLRANSASTANACTNATKQEKEQVKFEFTGIHATFSYGEDRCAVSLLEVQRFWAKDMDPSRDSILLSKTVQSSSAKGGDKKGASDADALVLMPILSETEHCARCGAAFLLEENSPSACTFHANQDGDPGEFKRFTALDDLTGAPTVLSAWTCCGRRHAFAVGCSARPHSCKEVMVQVRAEASPSTRVENVDLSVLKSVDISIFPNSVYDLRVHITKSLADVLHNYFSIDNEENFEISANKTTALTKVKNVGKRMISMTQRDIGIYHSDEEDELGFAAEREPERDAIIENVYVSPQRGVAEGEGSVPKTKRRSAWFAPLASPSSQTDPASPASFTAPPTSASKSKGRRYLGFFGGSQHGSDAGSLDGSTDTDSIVVTQQQAQAQAQPRSTFNMLRRRKNVSAPVVEKSKPAPLARSSLTRANSTVDAAELEGGVTSPATTQRQEGLYVKFLRLGGIHIEVSTAGFLMNLFRFKAQMDEFRCQGEVLSWSTLISNMERHLVLSVLRNAASSSISRFTHLFRFNGPSESAAADTSTGRKASYKAWDEVSDDVATTMKRSALGLPPPSSPIARHPSMHTQSHASLDALVRPPGQISIPRDSASGKY